MKKTKTFKTPFGEALAQKTDGMNLEEVGRFLLPDEELADRKLSKWIRGMVDVPTDGPEFDRLCVFFQSKDREVLREWIEESNIIGKQHRLDIKNEKLIKFYFEEVSEEEINEVCDALADQQCIYDELCNPEFEEIKSLLNDIRTSLNLLINKLGN